MIIALLVVTFSIAFLVVSLAAIALLVRVLTRS